MPEVEQAYSIIAEVLARSIGEEVVITPDTQLSALALDSLSLVEVIFEIEERFNVELPFNINDFARDQGQEGTVGDLIAMVAAARAVKGQAA
jgi:acyl carrier protein